MFSTAQLDLLNGLVSCMRDQGYLYYLAYTNVSSTSNDYDMFVYFSKDEIFATDMYRYTVMSGSLKYSIRSGNAYSSTLYDRFTVSDVELAEIGITVPSYCHVSTNATFTSSSVQPNYCLEVKQNETLGGVCFLLCVSLFVCCFFKLFRR